MKRYYIVDAKHVRSLVAGDHYDGHIYHQDPRHRLNASWILEKTETAGVFHIRDLAHQKYIVAGDKYDGHVYHQDQQGRLNAKWRTVMVSSKNGIDTVQLLDLKHHKAIIAGDREDDNVYHQDPHNRLNACWALIPENQWNMLNHYTGMFKDQHWLVAHNAWNTQIAANQCKSITELLNYGVRGFALDVYGDDEASLHLQHGHGNIASRTPWEKIRNELKTWLAAHKNEVVTLFFESYLTGPKLGKTPAHTALQALDNSLKNIPCYVSGKANQEYAITNKTLEALITENKRLFAFIEKEPDEGTQPIFPAMTSNFAENVYGDASLKLGTWVNMREGSAKTNPLTFMNHFGNAPTGSEWERNRRDLLLHHADAFYTTFGNRYPNFVSLDYINWDKQDNAPIEAVRSLLWRTLAKSPPKAPGPVEVHREEASA